MKVIRDSQRKHRQPFSDDSSPGAVKLAWSLSRNWIEHSAEKVGNDRLVGILVQILGHLAGKLDLLIFAMEPADEIARVVIEEVVDFLLAGNLIQRMLVQRESMLPFAGCLGNHLAVLVPLPVAFFILRGIEVDRE